QIPVNTHNLIKGENTPLHIVIPDCYKEFAADLKKYSILFMEQLTFSHGQSMLTFANLSVYSNTPHIRRIPMWFTKLQELLSIPNTCELRQKNLHSKEPFFNFILHNKIAGKQSFIVGWNLGNNQPVIGKLR
ncbi:2953_t:CDS:1, partial [Funneliformis geosporum]